MSRRTARCVAKKCTRAQDALQSNDRECGRGAAHAPGSRHRATSRSVAQVPGDCAFSPTASGSPLRTATDSLSRGPHSTRRRDRSSWPRARRRSCGGCLTAMRSCTAAAARCSAWSFGSRATPSTRRSHGCSSNVTLFTTWDVWGNGWDVGRDGRLLVWQEPEQSPAFHLRVITNLGTLADQRVGAAPVK